MTPDAIAKTAAARVVPGRDLFPLALTNSETGIQLSRASLQTSRYERFKLLDFDMGYLLRDERWWQSLSQNAYKIFWLESFAPQAICLKDNIYFFKNETRSLNQHFPQTLWLSTCWLFVLRWFQRRDSSRWSSRWLAISALKLFFG
jgi:hypothetical protein